MVAILPSANWRLFLLEQRMSLWYLLGMSLTLRTQHRPRIGILGILLTILGCAHSYNNPAPVVPALSSVKPANSLAEVKPSPVLCQLPCETIENQKINEYVIQLVKQREPKAALTLLKQCQNLCPQFACQFAKIYSTTKEITPVQEYSEAIVLFSNQCLNHLPQNLSAKDAFLVRDLQKEAMPFVLHSIGSPRKIGWAAIGIGSAFLVAAISMTIYWNIALPYFPKGPDGSWGCKYAGFDAPCADFSILYGASPLYVVGIGALGTGIGLLVHYRF